MSKADLLKEISIRCAAAEDARLVASLATVTFYEAYFEQDDPHGMADYLAESFPVAKIAAELADPSCHFFIVYRRGRAVGYAKMRDIEPHESVTSANPIELQRIYTVERVWGTDVGEALLRHCLEFARGLGKDAVWLGVWEENPRAMAFYEKHGFERVGTLEFPYGDTVGINAVMQIDLAG
jgi:ribosomal protein S18 acetylase RimI-like enzyme